MRKDFMLCAIVMFMFVAMFYVAGNATRHDTRKGRIVSVKNEVVTVKDTGGNLWEFEGTGFKVNDHVEMRMDNRGTDNDITDDIICDVKLDN